jgi:RNA polymerase-binding transcription factor DksA
MERDMLKNVRAELETELASVERQLVEHGGTPNPEAAVEVSTDEGFADSAQATTERSEMLSLIERCGQDIPIERLEARPTASLCVRCAQLVSH